MKKILLFSVLILSTSAHASLFKLTIEPIVGFERVQKLIPTAHKVDRMLYGARFSLGIPLLAIEAQATRGTDSETFTSPAMSVKDTDDRLKLGLRSSLRLGPILMLIARGGGQAKRTIHEETVSGVTSRTIPPIKYRPYAGLGLTSRLGSAFALSGGITAVFNNFPHMKDNDYETTLGFTVSLP